MIIHSLKLVFERDLNRLKSEIEHYRNEQTIWYVEKGIANSAGNLCLHIVGNLNAYIGVGLGNSGYIRNRELEFSLKDIPRADLLLKIDDTVKVVEDGLNKLTENRMSEDFPIIVWDKPTEMGFTLIHLATHLNYHLGQVNYHRRLLDY
jgi:hypothetical protein